MVDHPSATGQDNVVLILDKERAPAWKACIDGVHTAGGLMFIPTGAALTAQVLSAPRSINECRSSI
jgi:2,4-dienoyl-CoA reductase-like NADH-dependent reductase (Old Yellow Enzyme family)